MSRHTLFFFLLFSQMLLSTGNAGLLDLRTTNCRDFINETSPRLVCGFVELPLDHEQPDSLHKIKLPMLIARSPRSMMSNSERAILIPGAGGPGAAIGFGYQYRNGEFLQPYSELLQAGYDLIILDQRGAGLSSPRLTCFEAIDAFKELITSERNTNQEIQRYQQSASDCHSRLQQHGLHQFDTLQSARDFLSVMASLDYKWWGTVATSYATAITQTMLTLTPDAFDRVVLDSPVPLDFQKPITSESTYQSVLKSIGRCSNTQSCQQKYPALKQSFDRVLRRAASTPFRLSLNVYNAARRSTQTLIVDDDTLLSILANALYNNDNIATLPRVVAAMDRGQLTALKPYAADFWYQSTDDIYADGLNLTVHCKERQWLEKKYIKEHPTYLATLSKDSRQLIASQDKLCQTWGITTVNQPVISSKFSPPAVIISGSLDPVISSEDIKHTADDFSALVSNTEVKGAGHAVWFQSECIRRNVVDFFDHGTTDKLAACELATPAFK